jgi:acetyl esterase/lipase
MRAKLKNKRLADSMRVKKFSYGSKARQYLLMFNSQSKIKRNNLLFFIHGGGWNKGNPEFFKFAADYFTKLGFTTVMPAYRLVPDYRFPSQEIDIFKAIKKTLEILQELDLNSKIIIAGHSAGAHLGALILLNQNLQKEFEINNELFSGFLSISGPLDLSRPCRTKRAKKLLSGFVPTSKKRKNANPINYVQSDLTASVLCLHGAKDPLVPKEHSIDFIKEIEEKAQVETKLKILENRHHSDLAKLFFEEGAEDQAVKEWLIKVDSTR